MASESAALAAHEAYNELHAGNARAAAARGQAVQPLADDVAEEVTRLFFEFLERFRLYSHDDDEEEAGAGGGRRGRGGNGGGDGAPPSANAASDAYMEGAGAGRLVYVEALEHLRQTEETTFVIEYAHLLAFNDELADALVESFYRFEPYLRRALFEFVRKYTPGMEADQAGRPRMFWVSVRGLPHVRRLRDLRSDKIGSLLAVSGTVTRTSEVRPELLVGAFKCGECGHEVEGVEQQNRYTEPPICPSADCGNKRDWVLNVEKSKFVDWQRVRVQEHSSEIPAGAMPRTLDIVLRHESVERAKAGDKCVFTGTLVVIPEASTLAAPGERVEAVSARRANNVRPDGAPTGVREFGQRELNYRLCFMACHAAPVGARVFHGGSGGGASLAHAEAGDAAAGAVGGGGNGGGGGGGGAGGGADYNDEEDADSATLLERMTPEEREEIQRMKNQPRLYQRLVDSVAPTVFGHDEIKRGVLLMLFGGVHKDTGERINLRGDINVCIVGDPSTAKSQFLKYVCGFMPRAVYTSGKASSAAGLTASVVKDEDTNEFCIEAGALMLADNGVCCIDEFDKMDIRDQVAIHEAMEQQTISIAKAGIQATLNARASVLAAANPVGGRYDRAKTLKSNVQMSPAIMSRFDLFFIILDECEEVSDYNIARYIVGLHQHRQHALHPEYSTEQLRRYIRFARTVQPRITPESRALLVEFYKHLRQNDAMGGSGAYRITVRQLESMVRLSEALARLHLDEVVRPKYVKEAARLLRKSIIHVDTEDVELEEEGEGEEAAAGGEEQMRVSATERQQQQQQDHATPGATPTGDAPPTRRKQTFKMTFGEFRQLTNRVVVHLRGLEARGQVGIRENELIHWLLEVRDESHEITTEEELRSEAQKMRAAVKHMVQRDHVLVEVERAEEAPSEQGDGGGDDGGAHERLLAVHPNYVLDG